MGGGHGRTIELVTTRVVPYGPRAVLIELDGDRRPADVAAALGAEAAWEHATIVPAARSVLVELPDGNIDGDVLGELGEWLAGAGPAEARRGATALVEVPTVYGGADLDEVAQACGLDPAEVIARHTASTFTVAFCGFAPGFAYLDGLDERLRLPRRATPRTSVPAGSVAIADRYGAIYPTASPGGWHLLGTTDLRVFDPGGDPPSLLSPGTAVRFVAVPG